MCNRGYCKTREFDDKLMDTLKDIDNIFASNKDNYLEIDFNPLRI